jgi:voltage-gated potassium channel Kch
VFLSTLLIVFSSIGILQVENSPDSNIRGPEDALWWSVVTITTVGYGDRFPITTEGRFIGAVLMVAGIGLFAVLSGAFAAWFTDASQNEHELQDFKTTNEQLILLTEEVRTLRSEIGESASVHHASVQNRKFVEELDGEDADSSTRYAHSG